MDYRHTWWGVGPIIMLTYFQQNVQNLLHTHPVLVFYWPGGGKTKEEYSFAKVDTLIIPSNPWNQMNFCMPIHSLGDPAASFKAPQKTEVSLQIHFLAIYCYYYYYKLVGWLIGQAGVVYKGPRLTYQSVLAIGRTCALQTHPTEPVSLKRVSLADYQNRLIG